MLRQPSRLWDSSLRHPWLKRMETISPHTYLVCALVVIAVAAAAAGGKQPIASRLVSLSLEHVSSMPTDRASMLAILQVVLLIALLLLSARVGQIIESQHQALEDVRMRTSRLVEQCENLRKRLDAACIHSVQRHESCLHELGIQLRDRPLRLVEEALRELNLLGQDHEAAPLGCEKIRTALEDALAAIRATSTDLAVTEAGHLSAEI